MSRSKAPHFDTYGLLRATNSRIRFSTMEIKVLTGDSLFSSAMVLILKRKSLRKSSIFCILRLRILESLEKKIKAVRDQARMHMDEMLAAAKELETHEN